MIQKVNLLASKMLVDHPMVRLMEDTLEVGGKLKKYYYLISPVEAVAVVGLTDDNRILLTRQYRHPVGKVIYDLPAGRLNPGELPLDGARREFEEETGFYPDVVERLGYFNQFPGAQRAATHLFFARKLTPTRQNLDEGEYLDVVPKPVGEVLNWILNGEVLDGSLQLGVLLALQKGLVRP